MMKNSCRLLLILIGLWMARVSIAQKTFRNPIITGMNPDPSICRVGDDFYLVTSTFEYFPGLPVYHSKDLVHWKLIGHALSRPENNPLMGCNASTGGQYAPTLRYHDGTFYVIGTNYGGKGSQGVFYVTAKNPAGPWSDPVWVGNWYVDPSIEFIDGKMYFLSPDNQGSFLLGVMDPETGTFVEPLRKVASGLGGSSPEGPHFYKIGDYYYIMSAEGGTGYEHREVIQRSKSPWGPYEPSPVNPVLSNMNCPDHPFQAIGHADLVQLKDGSWWAVCLGIRPVNGKYQHLGRETFLAPVTCDAEGWPKLGIDGVVQETYLFPNLPSHVWMEQPVRDDFDQETLGLDWTFIRNPAHSFWSLTEKPGSLRLKGTAINFTTNDSPSFIGRRQAAFNLTASAKVNFIPKVENEEAGLVVRADDKNHYNLLITERNGQRVAMIRKTLKDKVVDTTCKELPATGEVILSITATETTYTFEIKAAHVSAILGTASTRDVSNEVVGGFTGVFIGMYASGMGRQIQIRPTLTGSIFAAWTKLKRVENKSYAKGKHSVRMGKTFGRPGVNEIPYFLWEKHLLLYRRLAKDV